MIEEKTDQNLLLHEYAEVNSNFRYFQKLRNSVILVYLVVFFITLLFLVDFISINWWSGDKRITQTKTMGIILTLIFLCFDIYYFLILQQLQNYALKLEEKLNFKQFDYLSNQYIYWLQCLPWVLYTVFLLFLVSFNS